MMWTTRKNAVIGMGAIVAFIVCEIALAAGAIALAFAFFRHAVIR
jgi:hypothetical protein